jgi:hypothetical protein
MNPSPAHDKGRKSKIDRVVIHWFGVGNLDAANRHFTRPNATTSAHYGIEDDRVIQWVREDDTAWHAGNLAMNRRSIGVEHSAEPNRPATEKTIQTSAKLIAGICKRYAIPLDRKHIIGHNEVKATQCPGTIPIDRIIQLATVAKNTPVQGDNMDREYRNNYYRSLDRIFEQGIKMFGVSPTDKWADNFDRLKEHTDRHIEKMTGASLQLDTLTERLENRNKLLTERLHEIRELNTQVQQLTASLEDAKELNKTLTEKLKVEQPEQGAISHLTQALKLALQGRWT